MNFKTVPVMQFFAKVEAARGIFRSVLGPAHPDKMFVMRDVNICGRSLRERTSSRVLAEAVLGVDFPRERGPAELDHYTTLKSFAAIAASGQINLHPVAKRLHQDELVTFAREHGLNGYFSTKNNKQYYKELAEDFFYLSLTKSGNNQTVLWNEFSPYGPGVRLRLRLKPTPAGEMRTVRYKTNQPTALKQINDALAKKDLVYTPWTIARICAFYLPLKYQHEEEVRLIVQYYRGGPDRRFSTNSGRWTVWPVPLAAPGMTTCDPWCEIELLSITTGPGCGASEVKAMLKNGPYSAVPVR